NWHVGLAESTLDNSRAHLFKPLLVFLPPTIPVKNILNLKKEAAVRISVRKLIGVIPQTNFVSSKKMLGGVRPWRYVITRFLVWNYDSRKRHLFDRGHSGGVSLVFCSKPFFEKRELFFCTCLGFLEQ